MWRKESHADGLEGHQATAALAEGINHGTSEEETYYQANHDLNELGSYTPARGKDNLVIGIGGSPIKKTSITQT
jgi:hypothetical protein